MEEKDDFWGEVASEQNESIPSMIISDGASSNENVLTGVTQTISAQQNQMVLMQKPSSAPKIIGVLVILWGGFTILLTLASPFVNESINNLLPEEERADLTMGTIDYITSFVSVLIGLGYIYSGNLMVKRQRWGQPNAWNNCSLVLDSSDHIFIRANSEDLRRCRRDVLRNWNWNEYLLWGDVLPFGSDSPSW